MTLALTIAELLLSLVIIVIVLLQAKGTSASVLGGGASSSSSYRTRRGLDKTLFTMTIVLSTIFLLLALLHPVLVRP